MGLKLKKRLLYAFDLLIMAICLGFFPIFIFISLFLDGGVRRVLSFFDSIISDLPRSFKRIFFP